VELNVDPSGSKVIIHNTNRRDEKHIQTFNLKNERKAYRRLRRRWKNRTKMDLKGIRCNNVDWMRLA
jgi:hypothetical protein